MKYQEIDRGNRLYPQRSSRIYWNLTALRKAFEDILRKGNLDLTNLLDYGCSSKPYYPLLSAILQEPCSLF